MSLFHLCVPDVEVCARAEPVVEESEIESEVVGDDRLPSQSLSDGSRSADHSGLVRAVERVVHHRCGNGADVGIVADLLVSERVSNMDQTGMAVVHGQEWTVRTRNDNEIIEPGEEAKILAISGVKLIVEKV